MSQKTKNASILSYFKPLPQSQPSQSQPSPSRPSASTAPTKPPQSPPLPSSPLSALGTPYKSTRGARPPQFSSTLEIQASDEDGDGSSSDNSLEDLSTLLGSTQPRNVVSPPRPSANPFATPRAKRTALKMHPSPLSILPKHKFDLEALAKDARRDDATDASSLRVHAAADDEDDMGSIQAGGGTNDALANIVQDGGGQDAHKVLRAVKRAEAGSSLLWYCFFDPEFKALPTSPLPKKAARTGPWRLLTLEDAKTREQYVLSGIPTTILDKMGTLPDEIFHWMLDEICVESSIILRSGYSDLVAKCPNQVQTFLTTERLEGLFLRLGAAEGIRNPTAACAVSKTPQDPYKERDWSCVESFLGLLERLSAFMSTSSVTYAAQTLLRMSMDRFLITNMGALMVYESALSSLVGAIPEPSWEFFCFETCSQMHANVKEQCIRINAVLCLRIDEPRLHQLRRRLAATFLFDDPALSRRYPDNAISFKDLIHRVRQDDFAVNPQTDFAELKATILFLDIAIDDGSFVPTGNTEDEKQFNQEVDELAETLRDIWRKINDTGMKLARTEAKSVIEWVQQRLMLSVRTRRRAKTSIFDIPGQREDPSLPQQQDFMKKFLKKGPSVNAAG
ncbi:hypothetical protein S40288_03436 [Stachybotrys chartarum IBT 40288]|nr:hypothetical protein S40288_03436 [Stachybotrys chartarum IBT 40288]